MATPDSVDADVRRLIDRVAERVLEQGAKAVLVVGSHARGEATAESDVDFFAVGDGPSERHEVVDGRLVSVHWFTPEEVRQRLTDPAAAVIAATAWRTAVVVSDPTGVGGELVREAADWSWEKIARVADAWVCDELVDLAEYVAKLARALDEERLVDAAALRAQVALRLGKLRAVRRRATFDTENGFWEELAADDDAEWQSALKAALACDSEDIATSAAAATQMFELLVADVESQLDEAQREVVQHVRATASARVHSRQ